MRANSRLRDFRLLRLPCGKAGMQHNTLWQLIEQLKCQLQHAACWLSLCLVHLPTLVADTWTAYMVLHPYINTRICTGSSLANPKAPALSATAHPHAMAEFGADDFHDESGHARCRPYLVHIYPGVCHTLRTRVHAQQVP